MKRLLLSLLCLVAFLSAGCAKRPYDPGKDPKHNEDPEPVSEITAPPSTLMQWLDGKSSPLSPWYTKYISDEGFPILASEVVRDEAILQCRYIVHTMLEKHPEARQQMIKMHWRVVICGDQQNITDIPECAMMKLWWPDTDWDARGRGYGATEALPVMSIGEENIVKIPNFRERYSTESIPAFITVLMMPVAYSISDGILLGVISYVLLNACAGKFKKISPTMWVLAVLFICKYIFI